jgi:hypothetical protein
MHAFLQLFSFPLVQFLTQFCSEHLLLLPFRTYSSVCKEWLFWFLVESTRFDILSLLQPESLEIFTHFIAFYSFQSCDNVWTFHRCSSAVWKAIVSCSHIVLFWFSKLHFFHRRILLCCFPIGEISWIYVCCTQGLHFDRSKSSLLESRRRKSWVVFANDLNHKAGNLRRKS